MPNLKGVVNHLRYIRSNWKVVTASFVLLVGGLLSASSVIHAGSNALAYSCSNNGYYDSYSNGYCSSGTNTSTPQTVTITCTCTNSAAPQQSQQQQPSQQPQAQTTNQQVFTCADGTFTYSTASCPAAKIATNSTPAAAPGSTGTLYTGVPQSTPAPIVPTTSPAPSTTPCPWWNSSYHCPAPANASPTPCPWWNNSYHCRQNAYGTNTTNGTAVKPTSGTLSWQTNAPAATTTSNTNQAQVTCSMSCQTQSAPVQTNTATTTMADAVIKPASTVVKSAPVPTPSNPVNELPETGTADTAIKFIGAGSLVAAGAAYASSRRELLRTVFKK